MNLLLVILYIYSTVRILKRILNDNLAWCEYAAGKFRDVSSSQQTELHDRSAKSPATANKDYDGAPSITSNYVLVRQ